VLDARFSSSVLSCLERERLEEELVDRFAVALEFGARLRGRNLTRLRHLTRQERAALDEREQAVLIRLRITTRSTVASGDVASGELRVGKH